MRRRPLLATIATGTVGAVAGCSGLTGPFTQRSFEICDTDCDWAEQTPDAGGEPVVVRSPDERRIVIYGNMYVGSSSCDRAVLNGAEVTDDTLRVLVGVGDRDGSMGGCTADMGSDQYRAMFRFRDELPETVVVEEDAAYDPEPSATPTDG